MYFVDDKYSKEKKNIKLIDVLDKDFYNGLLKLDFINDTYEMIDEDSLISIDIYDLKVLSNSKLVGVIKTSTDNYNEEFQTDRISLEMPTDCLLKITANRDVLINEVEQIVSNIRIKYNNCNLLYGIKIDKNQKIKYKLQAIFTFNDK